MSNPDYRTEEGSLIHRPDAKDMELVANGSGNVCGSCRYFSIAEGQSLMKAQRFIEVLVREHGWKPEYLCSPQNELGVCGATLSGAKSEAATITGRMHKACDQFRPSKGLISITRKTTDPR